MFYSNVGAEERATMIIHPIGEKVNVDSGEQKTTTTKNDRPSMTIHPKKQTKTEDKVESKLRIP
jgi:hypothetical protein